MKITQDEKKKLQIGIGVLIGGFVLFKIFVKKTETTPDPTGNGTFIPNQTVFNAHNVATSLYNAMKDWGTDEEAILEILKTVTQSQFQQVVTAFGKLNYNTTTGDQINYNPFSTLPKLGLKDWLNNELSAKEYEILRKKYPYSL